MRLWVYLLAFVSMLVQLGMGLISPILPLYAAAFDASLLAVGFAVSAYGFARVLVDIPSGILTDRISLGKLSLVSLVGVSVGALLSAFAWDYNSLLIGRILQGACTAFFQNANVVAVLRFSESSERGKALSVYWGISNVGLSLGPAFGGIIASLADLKAPFIGYAVTSLIGIPLLWPVMRKNTFENPRMPDAKAMSPAESLGFPSLMHEFSKLVFRNVSFMLVVFTSFAYIFVRTGVSQAIAPLMGYYSLKLDVVTVGAALTLSSFAAIGSMIPLGAYSDKVGRKRITELSLALLAVSLILIPLSVDAITFTLFMSLLGVSMGPMGMLSAWVTDLLEPGVWGKAIAVQRVMQDLAMALGPTLLSLFITVKVTPSEPNFAIPSTSFALSFLVSTVLVIVAALATWRARDPIAERDLQC